MLGPPLREFLDFTAGSSASPVADLAGVLKLGPKGEGRLSGSRKFKESGERKASEERGGVPRFGSN